MHKILFCCHGNICRSPSAEMIFNYYAKENQIDAVASSAATSYEEIGSDIYPLSKAVLLKHHIPCLIHHARHIEKDDYLIYDQIIGMDHANIFNLKQFFNNDPLNKISLLSKQEIADPWYSGEFEKCYEEIEEAVLKILENLK